MADVNSCTPALRARLPLQPFDLAYITDKIEMYVDLDALARDIVAFVATRRRVAPLCPASAPALQAITLQLAELLSRFSIASELSAPAPPSLAHGHTRLAAGPSKVSRLWGVWSAAHGAFSDGGASTELAPCPSKTTGHHRAPATVAGAHLLAAIAACNDMLHYATSCEGDAAGPCVLLAVECILDSTRAARAWLHRCVLGACNAPVATPWRSAAPGTRWEQYLVRAAAILNDVVLAFDALHKVLRRALQRVAAATGGSFSISSALCSSSEAMLQSARECLDITVQDCIHAERGLLEWSRDATATHVAAGLGVQATMLSPPRPARSPPAGGELLQLHSNRTVESSTPSAALPKSMSPAVGGHFTFTDASLRNIDADASVADLRTVTIVGANAASPARCSPAPCGCFAHCCTREAVDDETDADPAQCEARLRRLRSAVSSASLASSLDRGTGSPATVNSGRAVAPTTRRNFLLCGRIRVAPLPVPARRVAGPPIALRPLAAAAAAATFAAPAAGIPVQNTPAGIKALVSDARSTQALIASASSPQLFAVKRTPYALTGQLSSQFTSNVGAGNNLITRWHAVLRHSGARGRFATASVGALDATSTRIAGGTSTPSSDNGATHIVMSHVQNVNGESTPHVTARARHPPPYNDNIDPQLAPQRVLLSTPDADALLLLQPTQFMLALAETLVKPVARDLGSATQADIVAPVLMSMVTAMVADVLGGLRGGSIGVDLALRHDVGVANNRNAELVVPISILSPWSTSEATPATPSGLIQASIRGLVGQPLLAVGVRPIPIPCPRHSDLQARSDLLWLQLWLSLGCPVLHAGESSHQRETSALPQALLIPHSYDLLSEAACCVGALKHPRVFGGESSTVGHTSAVGAAAGADEVQGSLVPRQVDAVACQTTADTVVSAEVAVTADSADGTSHGVQESTTAGSTTVKHTISSVMPRIDPARRRATVAATDESLHLLPSGSSVSRLLGLSVAATVSGSAVFAVAHAVLAPRVTVAPAEGARRPSALRRGASHEQPLAVALLQQLRDTHDMTDHSTHGGTAGLLQSSDTTLQGQATPASAQESGPSLAAISDVQPERSWELLLESTAVISTVSQQIRLPYVAVTCVDAGESSAWDGMTMMSVSSLKRVLGTTWIG